MKSVVYSSGFTLLFSSIVGCASAPLATQTSNTAPRVTTANSQENAPHSTAISPAPVPRLNTTVEPLRQASSTVLTASERLLLVTNEDNQSIVGISTDTRQVIFTQAIAGRPVGAVVTNSGRGFVIDRSRAKIQTFQLSPDESSITMGSDVTVAADPVAMVLTRDGSKLYVTSGASNKLSVVDVNSMTVTQTVSLEREPRGLTFSTDEQRLFIGHLTGDSITVVNVPSMQLRRLRLPTAATRSAHENHTRRLGSFRRNAVSLARTVTLSPDGARLFVAHVAEAAGDSVEESFPVTYYGEEFTEAPTAVPQVVTTVSVLNTTTELWEAPTEREVSGRLQEPEPTSDPTAMAFDRTEQRLLVVSSSKRQVLNLQPNHSDPTLFGSTLTLADCDGPNGIAVRSDGTRYVVCQFDHTVQVIPPGQTQTESSITIGQETLSAGAAEGRRLFHIADQHTARQPFACSTCHPEGRDDGVVWITPRGPRQTIFLAGRMHDSGPFDWEGENPTLEQNMQQTMQRLRGNGYELEQRRAIAEYLLTGLQVPSDVRPTISQTMIAQGERVFRSSGCEQCHVSTSGLSDGHNHDVSSFSRGDATRLFNTPSLRLIGLSAPYYHDGRFPTLDALVNGIGNTMGHTSQLNRADREALVAFLGSL